MDVLRGDVLFRMDAKTMAEYLVSLILKQRPDLKLGDTMVATNCVVDYRGRLAIRDEDFEGATVITARPYLLRLPFGRSFEKFCEEIDGDYIHPYRAEEYRSVEDYFQDPSASIILYCAVS